MTLTRCWRKAGILPDLLATPSLSTPLAIPVSSLVNDQDPIVNMEKQLEAALDDLISTGALQYGNRMSIQALLNPVEELTTMNETTDEDIYQAVIDAKETEYTHEDGDEAPAENRPTRKEALQAMLVIQDYIRDIDDPFARKIESALSSLGHQTRLEQLQSMSATRITDYFHRV
jgi:hypothetical protein